MTKKRVVPAKAVIRKLKTERPRRRAVLIASALPQAGWMKQALEELGLREQDLRVGVDGGTRGWLDQGLVPELVVGDGDSLGGLSRPERERLDREVTAWIDLPEHKDRSDLYFGALAALHAGAEDLVCLGVTGGRPDHQLAMLDDLSELAQGARVTAWGEDARYIFVSSKFPARFALPAGAVFSVLPLGGVAQGVDVRGGVFSLRGERLEPGSQGLSNVVAPKATQVQVSARKGSLVVIVPSGATG